MALAGSLSTTSSVPMAPSSTKITLSAIGGLTLTALKPRASTRKTTRSAPNKSPTPGQSPISSPCIRVTFPTTESLPPQITEPHLQPPIMERPRLITQQPTTQTSITPTKTLSLQFTRRKCPPATEAPLTDYGVGGATEAPASLYGAPAEEVRDSRRFRGGRNRNFRRGGRQQRRGRARNVSGRRRASRNQRQRSRHGRRFNG